MEGVLDFILQYINTQIINKRPTKPATIHPIAPPDKPDFDGRRLLGFELEGVFHIKSYQKPAD
jgi:hypothetical protein